MHNSTRWIISGKVIWGYRHCSLVEVVVICLLLIKQRSQNMIFSMEVSERCMALLLVTLTRCRFKEIKKLDFTLNLMFSDRLYYSFFPDVFVDRPKYLFYCCMISQKLFGMLSGYFRHRCSHLLCRWKKQKTRTKYSNVIRSVSV